MYIYMYNVHVRTYCILHVHSGLYYRLHVVYNSGCGAESSVPNTLYVSVLFLSLTGCECVCVCVGCFCLVFTACLISLAIRT